MKKMHITELRRLLMEAGIPFESIRKHYSEFPEEVLEALTALQAMAASAVAGDPEECDMEFIEDKIIPYPLNVVTYGGDDKFTAMCIVGTIGFQDGLIACCGELVGEETRAMTAEEAFKLIVEDWNDGDRQLH